MGAEAVTHTCMSLHAPSLTGLLLVASSVRSSAEARRPTFSACGARNTRAIGQPLTPVSISMKAPNQQSSHTIRNQEFAVGRQL